jgi:hypothetical protein
LVESLIDTISTPDFFTADGINQTHTVHTLGIVTSGMEIIIEATVLRHRTIFLASIRICESITYAIRRPSVITTVQIIPTDRFLTNRIRATTR